VSFLVYVLREAISRTLSRFVSGVLNRTYFVASNDHSNVWPLATGKWSSFSFQNSELPSVSDFSGRLATGESSLNGRRHNQLPIDHLVNQPKRIRDLARFDDYPPRFCGVLVSQVMEELGDWATIQINPVQVEVNEATGDPRGDGLRRRALD
jgi:hypothetical protein